MSVSCLVLIRYCTLSFDNVFPKWFLLQPEMTSCEWLTRDAWWLSKSSVEKMFYLVIFCKAEMTSARIWLSFSNNSVSHSRAHCCSAVITEGMRKSPCCSQGWELGQVRRARGLHSRQVFEVTEFSREGAQPGAEGAPLLAVFFPSSL